jgi:SAM-dependent methyltransferase
VEDFNHNHVVRNAPPDFHHTLEIGAGIGEHLFYEQLTSKQESGYYALELRDNMAADIRIRFPRVQTIVGDCRQRLNFEDGYFDRILAVHVLEHLPNLPVAVEEMYRLSDKRRGVFSVVIPCEGSLAYSLARRLSAQRIFEKRYKQSYRWEHINKPEEIMAELRRFFAIVRMSHFPLRIPLIFCNLCIGLTLRPTPQKSRKSRSDGLLRARKLSTISLRSLAVHKTGVREDMVLGFTAARIPKGNRKNLPRFSSAPNAIRIARLELVVLICRFTTDCFSASGRPE